MQPLQQLLTIHMHLSLALHQITSRQKLSQLMHSPAGQELKRTDVGSLLILKQAEELLHLALSCELRADAAELPHAVCLCA